MNLNCPSCQKMLQVPDQYAGQMMKCPLCTGTFSVPALGSSGTTPAAPAPTPPSKPSLEDDIPPPPMPRSNHEAVGGYLHAYTFHFSPRLVSMIAPLSLILVLVLWFFPWLTTVEGTNPVTMNGLQANLLGTKAFGLEIGPSALGILYSLVLLPTVALALASTAAAMLPSSSLPPALMQMMPFRSFIVAVAAMLAFVFLMIQVVTGFSLEAAPEMRAETIFRTFWLRLAVFAQVLAILGALMDFWLAMRGNSKPVPKVEIMW